MCPGNYGLFLILQYSRRILGSTGHATAVCSAFGTDLEARNWRLLSISQAKVLPQTLLSLRVQGCATCLQ